MNTKEKILITARDLIYENGYAGTSVNDILVAANIGKGQFYHYFESKHDIALKIIELNISEWEQKLFKPILMSDNNPDKIFCDMIDWFSKAQESGKPIFHGCHIGNLIVEFSAKEEYFRTLLRDLLLTLADLIAKNLMRLNNNRFDTYGVAFNEAKFIIAVIQGNTLLLKATQDINVFKDNLNLLKNKYLK
ncbi:transcriptional regulator, TetR family [Gemella bergeri ATCC 700627]|uniref:Transcriptional regulator, TetR family n=1 Tax=Gemella bergeri ATCC 700627 TaxID=1321820 RepID=U2QM74_9BACL|nr:TetR/AcrR family transcriptional regulator [Gemella bergeri]ERK57611.1 transcriptional regulator, TetR family [Gemella bergeri ATCC 700627]